MSSSKRARHVVTLALTLAGLLGLLILPSVQRAAANSGGSSPHRTQKQQTGSGLDSERKAALDKLYEQLKGGAPFSEEEADILRRFASGGVLTDLEADVVLSRALYDYYVAHKEMTKGQQGLFDRYSLFASTRSTDVLDLKKQLLEKRIAAAAAAPIRNTPLAPPANDQCAGAEVIPAAGPFPYLTAVTADITDATATGDPPNPTCQANVSRSIWYTFTPSLTAGYRISACSSDAPGSTVEDTVMSIYTSSTTACGGTYTEIPTSGGSDGCDDDSCVTGALQSVITTQLTAGTHYFIVVREFGSTPPVAGSTAVQLSVTQFINSPNDACGGAIALSLNIPVNGQTGDGTNGTSNNDYQLSGSACFTGVGNTATTAPGLDVVYSFTAPSADTYSFKVFNYTFSVASDLVLYVASSCPAGTPPVTVSTCLAAANRSVSSLSEEISCLPLTAGQQVFVFVDESAATPGSTFSIVVTRRCAQESDAAGANNTPATANVFSTDQLACGIKGAISPAGDVDFFSLGTPATGSRVFAMVDGVASNSSDFDLRVTTATDTLEYDDLSNDPPFGSFSPNIAGTPTNGTQTFLRVNQFTAATVAEPYRLYAVVQPPIGSATTETEPNGTTAQADANPVSFYVSGSLTGPAPSTDVDVFRVVAAAGETLYVGLDGDPLRDSTPIDAKLELLAPGGGVLLSVNDGSQTSCQAGTACDTTPPTGCTHPSLTCSTPTSPSEGLIYTVPTAGTYYVRVTIGTTSNTSIGAGDYLLSISKCSAPTAVTLSNDDTARLARATSYDSGVGLSWQTASEVDNLGFNVYRDEGGKRTRVNSQLIAGSALKVGAGTTLEAGQTYTWWDGGDAQTLGRGDTGSVAYWIEDVDLNGRSTLHGPISISGRVGRKLSSEEQTQTALLSQLGLEQNRVASTDTSGPIQQYASVASASATPQQFKTQTSLASEAAAKASVKQEGWYRITQAELLASGISPDVDPRNLQLFVDGQQQPIKAIGESDGRFDPEDSIEFYGVGTDSAVTDARTYWVTAGSQPGLRIGSPDGKGGAPGSRSFPYTVERRDRSIYFAALRNGDAENFFGAVIASAPVDQSLTIQHLDPSASGACTVEVAVQGVTSTAHHIKIQVNGRGVADLNFFGQSHGTTRMSVSSSLLREGSNVATLVATGGPSDVSLVDYVRITYPHTYTADGNALKFTASKGQKVSVDGFTDGQISAFDVTDSNAVREMTVVVKKQPGGTFAATTTASGKGQRSVMMLASARAKHPAAIWANTPSKLASSGQGADLLIITRREFFGAVEPLALRRASQGLSVMTVDIEDVYDEFSFGQKTPGAIRDFLKYARESWQKAPQFVLLGADASVDPKNYLGQGDFDLIPTKLIDTQYMEAPSDDWFGDFDGSGVPQLAFGRLPARTAAEAAGMVSKIIRYEQAPPSEEMLLVADSNDSYNFEQSNTMLLGIIPREYRINLVNRDQFDAATTKSILIEAINRGQKIVSYTGHGSANVWRANLLTSADMPLLGNENNLSLFVMMTCLNGYFVDTSVDSLAESLLKWPHGGAVAVWASTGMSGPGDQTVLNQTMFRFLFQGEPGTGRLLTLGEASNRAKAAVADPDVRRSWILFGDPSARLR